MLLAAREHRRGAVAPRGKVGETCVDVVDFPKKSSRQPAIERLSLIHIYADKRDRIFGYFPRLYERRTQLAGSLSGGEQQMLAIGRALMAEPRLLLVDELSLGLMPKMVDICLEVLVSLKGEGFAILLVEQNTARALDVADRVCVLSSGVQAFQGTAADAKASGSMFTTFLGSGGQ